MFTQPGTAYTVFVVIILMLVIGLFSKKGLSDCFKQVSKGMGSMAGIFLLFILLNIMLTYVNYGGGFEALGKLFLSMIGQGSRSLVVILARWLGRSASTAVRWRSFR